MKTEVRRIDIIKTDRPYSNLLGKESDEKWHCIKEKGEEVTRRFIKYPINPWRDKAQICLNGHFITSTYDSKPHDRKDYCNICGKKTITECPKCHGSIPGDLYSPFYLY